MNPLWTGRNHGCSKQGYDDSKMLQSYHSSLRNMKKEIERIFHRAANPNNKSTNSMKWP